jgi:uroporphyrinogen decarboxylase
LIYCGETKNRYFAGLNLNIIKSVPKKLINALNGGVSSPPPFWFMRQAGRYMPEYRELRAHAGSFLNLCMNDKWATEVTLQPIRKFGMDAAILFADILLIPMALGVDLKFETGEGPVLGKFGIEDLKFDEAKLEPVYKTLRNLSQELGKSKTTLIGFAGSPWTVATYMVEGGSSRSFTKSKAALNTPEFAKIMDILVESTSQYLISQIKAGAEVVQLFDSWASALEGADFEKWVIEPNARVVENIRKVYPNTPIICFPKGAKDLVKFAERVKPNGMGLDSSVSLEWAFANLNCTLQGNLDPQILRSDKETIKREAEKILAAAKDKPFIFNLGHGIDKETPMENIEYLCSVISNS